MSDTDLKYRLTAILAADAAGYSRLMSLDERSSVAALDAARSVFRRQIEASQGRVIDMAGDSVLAVFETAAGAVGAALAVQLEINALADAAQEDRRMRFRIGVHLGDVIEKPDGTVYGDGVNIAARLEGLAEPGGITVSDAIHGAVRGKVDATFIDQGEQQVKNIEHPIRAYRVQVGDKTEPVTAGAPTSKRSTSAAEIDLSLPDKPSIAVLPFSNMSGDPEQEYFTEGITEDIITELSGFHSLFVIARNSSFTYKGKPVDVRTVSRELGVRYVLEGSIRRAAGRIRVTAQLIDAITGNHIWAEKYDRVLEDVFAVQEEVTGAIVAAIAPHVETFEADRALGARPGNLGAYELALRSRAKGLAAWFQVDEASRDQALVLAREALAIDPQCGAALRALALVQWQRIYFNTSASPAETIGEGIAAATRAIAIDHGDHTAHWLKGILLYMAGQTDAALANLRRAHELNPNDARALSFLGVAEANAGDPLQGMEHARQALRLSPRDPMRHLMLHGVGFAHLAAKQYAEAIEWAQRSVVDSPNFPSAHLCLVLSWVGLGEVAKARAEFQVWRSLVPGQVEARLAGQWPTIASQEFSGRATTFMRIAAGLEDPGAAQAWR